MNKKGTNTQYVWARSDHRWFPAVVSSLKAMGLILLPFIGKPPIFDGGLRKPIANWAKRMGVLTGEPLRIGAWRKKVWAVAGGHSTGTRGPWTPIIHPTPGLPPTSGTLHFLHLLFFPQLAFLLHLAFLIAHPPPLRTPMRPHCHIGTYRR